MNPQAWSLECIVHHINPLGWNRIDGGQSHDSLRLVSLIYRPFIWTFVSGLWNIRTNHMNHHDGTINVWRTITWTSAIAFFNKNIDHLDLGIVLCSTYTRPIPITSGLSSYRPLGTDLLNLLLFTHFLNHLCFHSVRISVDYRKALRSALLLPVAKGLLPIVSL